MPVYEYWCQQCRRRISSYQPSSSSPPPTCPHCGGGGLERLFSTFAMHKTYHDVYEDILGDRDLKRGMLGNDPRAMSEWNRRMTGGEKPTPEYEEITERMDKGEWPMQQLDDRKREFFGDEAMGPRPKSEGEE